MKTINYLSFSTFTFSVIICLVNSAVLEYSYAELLQALNYNDSCDYEIESVRQNYLVPGNPSQAGILRRRYVETVERLQQPMCNALKLLVCNPQTNRCDCGNPAKIVFNPGVAGSEGFTVEDGQYCRWAVGGYCTPEIESEKDNASQWCERGATCMLTGNTWGVCSYAKIVDYLITNNITSTKAGNTAIMSGKVCSCKKEPSKNTL